VNFDGERGARVAITLASRSLTRGAVSGHIGQCSLKSDAEFDGFDGFSFSIVIPKRDAKLPKKIWLKPTRWDETAG
jgi:hypothetical protein